MFGGEEISEEKQNEIKANPIKMAITFNNQEWIAGQDFKYHDHTIERVAWGHQFMDPAVEQEQRDAEWEATQE